MLIPGLWVRMLLAPRKTSRGIGIKVQGVGGSVEQSGGQSKFGQLSSEHGHTMRALFGIDRIRMGCLRLLIL